MAHTEHLDAHDDAHDHGMSHVLPIKTLLSTWGALMVLTLLTVGATLVDFGPSVNLALGMAIAVVKATLVIVFFMHLRYDKIFHAVLLVGGILAAALFVGFLLMDSSQYQDSVIWNVAHPPSAPFGPRPTL